MKVVWLALFTLCIACIVINAQSTLSINGNKLGRTFDGIGGLSGGGATSRLLIDYPQPERDDILDYLFLPNFGASLHILKVEIGGDCQTTDGTEPSHMHTRNDLNYERGYEWWLIKEAKKRNPAIKLYALSWGVPGWIGNGNYFSDDNVLYQTNWVKGLKSVYGYNLDYIGIWNERSFTTDKNCTYIKNLRSKLDSLGFQNVQIVAADGGWDIVNYLQEDPVLYKDVGAVGVHYPGTTSPASAVALNKTLWASEDYSTFADTTGGGCWARILNQNYVNGYMTATISWNLIAAYYRNLPYGGDGLMWAENPWTGYYSVQSPIWVTAHTSQFVSIGAYYLAHESGVGHLPSGGSYVTFIPNAANSNKDFTVVIETMTHDRSECIRPALPPYTVKAQTVTFQLSGGLESNAGKILNVWMSHLGTTLANSILFEKSTPVRVNSQGQFTLSLGVDQIYTITTSSKGNKGSHATPPNPQPFSSLLPYFDSFESYPINSEAKYFADQTGSFAIESTSDPKHNKVLRQEVLQSPIVWCGEASSPITFIGEQSLTDVNVTVDFLIEDDGWVVLGGRVPYGGCGNNYGSGYFFTLNYNGKWSLTVGSTLLTSGTLSNVSSNKWYTISLVVVTAGGGVKLTGTLNGQGVFNYTQPQVTYKNGWAILGSGFNYVQFDNFYLSTP